LKDVESKDYRSHLSELQSTINSVKGGLTDGLPATLGESRFPPSSRHSPRKSMTDFETSQS
jgi:hypothetical protein